ncbi:MAG: putative selenate reductase subunit YgfK [Epulopiscium sp. Nuni2H_MBin003]|nr:MAG: putative selenate reductase subunit YgfK [Epulopiscium sp. Nuni2H_MBin003]
MSDIMIPIPFKNLLDEILNGKAFGVYRPFVPKNTWEIFGRKLETPIGPAAGPQTQLAQNLVASYYSGSRFFELKTVQILDGEDLPVSKPCILADDECYNCEWSTELYVPQAQEEYIKGWFLLAVMAKERGLGEIDGFQFNMSVGYDLDGIKSEKINTFIDSMMNAADTTTFKECKQYLLDNINLFKHLTKEDIENISPNICNSITLSTLHGCPPEEIERIATYLITEKGLNTFIKCNPTLLGYEYARQLLDDRGFDYIQFSDFHFKDDLQYEDAVPMLKRLQGVSEKRNLQFGVKITNTFPVDVTQNELPSEEMYMSGKALYPLSLAVAKKLSDSFEGTLRISYSGGADAFNIKDIVDAGIWPVTVATTILKPGGYQRFAQLCENVECKKFTKVDYFAISKLLENSIKSKFYLKPIKPMESRKLKKKVPLIDCFIAPCKQGCPINQDVTAYLDLVGKDQNDEALKVIVEKNPLPFITGTICPHNCMTKCTRNFYEEPVHIRGQKLLAADKGFTNFIANMPAAKPNNGKTVSIVGGGPAGMSAAFFLSRAGFSVTIYEATAKLGGVVRNVIPEFRIESQRIDKDAQLIQAYGVDVKYNTKIEDITKLESDATILAIGAYEKGTLKLEQGETINAIDFLKDYKQTDGNLNIGKNVVVIGGGNTAMDTARAAKKTVGVENVYLVYRRTKRYMPADEEELVMAIEDGVEFKELLAPKSLENGQLIANVMKLSEMDSSGRRGVVATDEIVNIPADTVIVAVGEKIPTKFYEKNNLETDKWGQVVVNPETLESKIKNVYVIGDGLAGPATVVEGIRDAKLAANSIAGCELFKDYVEVKTDEQIYAKRGILEVEKCGKAESDRCLSCGVICENCVEVCPNRANMSMTVNGRHQVVHIDSMCNECGNCTSFCPYESSPYLDKFTYFEDEKAMMNSKNEGFMFVDATKYKVRLLGEIIESDVKDKIPQMLHELINTARELV